MDLIHVMRSFVRVYETQSFSAAAKDLSLSQPSVSKAVAQLEQALGTQLFLRSTRGLTPTDAGQKFYEHSIRTLDEADRAVTAVKGENAPLTGRLRVSGTITFMSQHIIPRLPIFLERHPDLTIDMLLDDGNIGLVEEGAEVALRMGKLASSNLTARRIGQCRRVVIASPSYLEKHGRPKKPSDLETHAAIVLSRGEGGEHITFSKDDLSIEVMLQPRMRVSALEGLRAAVLAGMGLAVASEWIVQDELESGQVVEVVSDWTMQSLDLWMVLPNGARHASSNARAFIAFVEDQLAATRYGVS
ncbi:LysR family transcriptional regulator [Pseudomonas sp. G2-4]|uniref:LysR family transcriptional regulator n=1 Tax=Pseudomonas sp. G2-4 TaxID=1506334 RepID=UPI0024B9513D|nr:LysR family transcriptional regulator [Pseudomonas sp. G2-4]WHS60468.1 LysR family transcriptional regulator [Pseudomonas sp. G2-4]